MAFVFIICADFCACKAQTSISAVIRYPFVGSVGLNVSRNQGSLYSNCLPTLRLLCDEICEKKKGRNNQWGYVVVE